MGQARRYDQISRGRLPGQGELGKVLAGVGGGSNGPNYSACNVSYDEGTVETFDCYEVEDPITYSLSAHQGWSGAWVLKQGLFTLIQDSFNVYTVEDPLVATLESGNGWTGAWDTSPGEVVEFALDDCEDYAAADPASSLNGGDGWTAGWTIVKKT